MTLILDVDTGRDDAWTILSARNQSLPLTDIITSYGCTDLKHTHPNTHNVIRHVFLDRGLNAPKIWQGTPTPSILTPENTTELRNRASAPHDGLYNYEFPTPYNAPLNAHPQHDALASRIKSHFNQTGPVDYLVCGPFTNLALLAAQLGPKITQYIRHLYVSGGTFNRNSPAADFNFLADPAAAKKVLTLFSGRVSISRFDTTRKLTLNLDEIAALPETTPEQHMVKTLMHRHAISTANFTSLHDPSALSLMTKHLPTMPVRASITPQGKLQNHPSGELLLNVSVLHPRQRAAFKSHVLGTLTAP